MARLVRLWVGTYPDPSGAAEGVWSVTLDAETGELGRPEAAARTPAPSFLAATPDGRAVFAAGETDPGAVTRFAADPERGGALTERQRVGSGGSSPCHLLLHPRGRALYAANYGSGSVAVLPLRPGPDGDVELAGGVAQVFEHAGRGPVADRQEGPHAHSTALTPDGSALLALDLGTDEVRRYRLRADGLLDADGVAARLPPGTGPRHAAWGPGGHLYVVGELDIAVHVLAWAEGMLRPVGRVAIPTAPGGGLSGGPGAGLGGDPSGDRADEPGAPLPAHVRVVGRRLLVSVRGPDVVAAWRVAGDGAVLVPLDATPVGLAGAGWPRHFAVVGGPGRRWLVVAGQETDRLVALPLGESRRTSDDAPAGAASVALPAPTCVVVGRTDPPGAG